MTSTPRAAARPEFIVWCAALLACALKLYCACTTIGTTDVFLHTFYGKKLSEIGLVGLYQATQHSEIFNHTPLIAAYFAGAYKSAVFVGAKLPFLAKYFPPREPFLVPLFLRIPPILADLAAVWVLLRIRRKLGEPSIPLWALTLFALSPVSFMVSGYHGNFDSMMVLFLLLAGWMCLEENLLLCALFLGISCNIKIISVLIGPVFFFYWVHRGQGWRFAVATGAVCLAGWSIPLVECPLLFLHNVLGYNSYWGIWGVTSWLRATHLPAFQRISFMDLSLAQKVTMNVLKFTVIFGILFLAWRRRALPARSLFTTIACAWAIFFTVAPGVCAQYMVWPAPFVLLCSAEWYLAFTAASAVFLFQFYNTISLNPEGRFGMPWFYGFSTNALSERWVPWTNLPWLVMFAALAIFLLSSRKQSPDAIMSAEPVPEPAPAPLPAT